MQKGEYFSNSYRVMITNKPFHFIVYLSEYLLTLITQVTLSIIGYEYNFDEILPSKHFYIIFIQHINKLPEYIKLLIIIIIFVLIFVYFFIYNKFAFENKFIFNIITINFFEIFIFRCFFMFLLNLILSIQGISLVIILLISIAIIALIFMNIFYNHLHYFSPHFIVYPYDYYSSMTDLFHIIEKICLSIALQNLRKSLNQFFFILSYVLQIGCFIYSVYIFKYKSYCIMSNIFLNKSRFSFIASSMIINFIAIIQGKKNYLTYTYLLLSLIIYFVMCLLVQIFYNPYSNAYFLTDDSIDNLYFYYYIIDHLRNDSFLLECKIREHFLSCQKCNLCKNIRGYLTNKKCYKIVYKILYNKVGVLEHTMNELIHIVLVSGKEALKYNSFYLINLMYCYYININKKNFVLSLNLKLLFEVINLENKNILENHLLSTEQILLINEFLSKSDNILKRIQLILTETIIKEKVNHFFDLYEILLDLKSKKFKSKLYYNKNEGIINFYKYISICSMIYEEIFNVSLSNGGVSLKENPIFLDDMSNKNAGLNQIIIQLNLLNFENMIIYIVGEFAKYKGKALCQLFPNIFKTQQLSIMKNKIMNAKFLSLINKDKDFFQSNTLKGKNNEEQHIDLQLLVFEEVSQRKIYVMIKLKLNLIYPLGMAKQILLTGFYSVDRNIIITLDKSTNENKKEIVLNSGESKFKSEIGNYSTQETELIKYKKKDKYYNGKKLFFVTKFYVNPHIYNIYSLFTTEKQKTYKKEKIMDGIARNNLYDIESRFGGGESTTQNLNFMQTQTSSTFNQITKDVQNFKRREKGGKKDNKKIYYLKYYQIGLLIIALVILLFQFLSHILLNYSIKGIDNKNSVLMMLKNYFGIFNNIFTSTLSLACLAENESGKKCQSMVSYFEKEFSQRKPGPPLVLEIYTFMKNYGMCFQISAVRQLIVRFLTNSNDETMNELINSNMTSLIISENYTKDGNKLTAHKQTKTFMDVLNHLTAALVVLNSDDNYLNYAVYIVNRFNLSESWTSSEEPFKYVHTTQQLSDYQKYFYLLLLNYQPFLDRMEYITGILLRKTEQTIQLNISYIYIIIVIVLLAYILLIIVIYLYIQRYYKIIAELLDGIEKKMELKNEQISVREMFLQKIEKLRIIISLYKQDIYQAIVDLNFIYDNYKKFIDEKNKEMAKYLKKEKYFIENNYNSKDKTKKIIQTHISSIKSNLIYLYFIIFIFVVSIASSITLYLLWNEYKSKYNKIYYLIKSHGNLSNDAYKIVNYYQLMLYNSFTLEDINSYEKFDVSKGDDLFRKLYTDIEDIYESNKYNQNIAEYRLNNIDIYFNYTCKTFFDSLYETNSNLKQKENPTQQNYFIEICETANIFKSNNYKHIFSMLIEMIQIGINQIHDHSYEGLILIKKSEHFIKTTKVFLYVYYFAFEILSYRVQRQSYEKIFQLIDSYLLGGFLIYYFVSFIFILVIILVYIFRFNKNYRQLHEIKKVFKICNKQE